MTKASNGSRRAVRYALPRLAVSFVIAGVFVWALQRGGLRLAPPSELLPHLRWWAVPAFIGLILLSNFFRNYRLVFLLRPMLPTVSVRRVFAIGMVGYGAIFFAPLRLGEVVRPYLLSQDEGATIAQGLGVVTAERIVDGLFTVAITTIGLALSTKVVPLPDHLGNLPIPVSFVPGALWSAALLFGVAFVAMSVLFASRAWIVAVVRRVLGALSLGLANAVARLVERVAQGFAFLPSIGSGGSFLLHSVCCWASTAAAHWVLFPGVGMPATLAQGCVVMGVLALGSLLPAGPGFFGAYQLSTYTAMAMFFPAGDVLTLGALYVFVSYACHVIINAGMAVSGLLMLRRPRPLAQPGLPPATS